MPHSIIQALTPVKPSSGRYFPGSASLLLALLLASCGGGGSGASAVDEVVEQTGSTTAVGNTPVADANSPVNTPVNPPTADNNSDSVAPDETAVASTPIATPSEPAADTPVQSPTTPLPLDPSFNGGSVVTTASAQAPQIDSAGDVIWPFAPVDSGLTLEVLSFVEMPLASSGRPARWNDMEFTGERLFVSNEKDGRIFEITGRQANLWFDVAAAISNTTAGALNTDNPFHGGVRGFAFHPEFSTNGKFYVSMMQDRPANPADFNYISDAASLNADSVVVEWTANPQTFAVDTSSYRELFRVGIPEFDHPIKQIAFNPFAQPGQEDYGLLFIAHGDGRPEASAEADGEGNNALGKILRINPLQSGADSYSVPASNPFVGNAAMADEVYSLGHRNPHHLAFMPDGRLLATESGLDNIDEINLIEKGANYGWARREGAFVQLGSGSLAAGIGDLPADDAANGLTYPIAQFGHTGPAGATFTGEGLGGGFMTSNGSNLDGEFFYIDFVNSGRLFHSSYNSIIASQTVGDPSQLTMAQTFESNISFDNDGDAGTAAIPIGMPELLQSTGSYDGSGRVDVRIGQGPLGEMYLMNKRNNVIYLVRNSYPPGVAIPEAPSVNTDIPATTSISFNITVPAYVSDALQVRLQWGDTDITGIWVVDETWSIIGDFPTNTEDRLTISFNDRNGEITLGTVEQAFRTGVSDSQTVAISADQFDTERWDTDGDGESNISELIAGSDPLMATLPITFAELQSTVFQRCDGCHDDRSPSGGLDLTPGNSFANLVNVESNQKEGAILVIPFDPDNSYLIQKMEDAPGIVGRDMNFGAEFNRLTREWVASGALNN